MPYKYVIAIVRPDSVAPLERKLTQLGVSGITLSRVKGFGEYKNFFSDDWLSEHTKLEIFVEDAHVAALLDALRASASDVPGAGVAAVMPVEAFQHLRAGSDAASDHKESKP
ncbi:P-II family nitrogen regulator [Sphaerotilus sp.]|uniref:P-II family nitrogen regulator n=1 Tax=Sphaerotilus sp. TaxID=2093942 RepID=UPI002ACDDF17|nr:P-II family nitrogen regulator [Sphaerotilus sp.]MDZ7855773.1 P-II family nitrogen regulator [Sphaerotilus sp.]